MTDGASEPRSIGQRLQINGEHWCFGCGHLNPIGLKLVFFEEPETGAIWADWTPQELHQGFAGMTHGGLISTVLDEVMGWAIYARQAWAVTAKLTVNFRRPVETNVPTRARAWIERDVGRKLDVRAELRRLSDDQLLAEADALFVRVPEGRAREWQARYLSSSQPVPERRS